MQSLAFSIASRGISSNRTRAVWSASCSVMPVIMFHFLVDSLATRILERRSRDQTNRYFPQGAKAQSKSPCFPLWQRGKACPEQQSRREGDFSYAAYRRRGAILCAVRLRKLGRIGSRQTTEHCPFHQARAAGIIIKERSASDLTRGEKSADHVVTGVFDLAFFGNADAAERKGDATRHRKGVKRRRVKALRPVRLRRTDPASAFAVVLRWIKRRIVHGGIEFIHCFNDVRPV